MKRASIYIFNFIIFALCALVIALYILFPVIRIKVTCNVDSEMVQSVLGDTLSDYGIDVDDVMGDEPYPITATVSINSLSVINALFTNDSAGLVTEVVAETLDPLIDDLSEIFVGVATSVATSQVISIAKDYLADFLNQSSELGYTDEEIQNILNSADITDEYLTQEINEVMSALTADGATVDSVTAEVIKVVEDIYAKAAASDAEEFSELVLDDETKEQIRNEVAEYLDQIAAEDGSVSVDSLLAKALEYLNGSSSDEGAVGGATALSVARVAEDEAGSSSSTDIKTELKTTLTELVTGYLSSDILSIINIVVIVLAALMLFTFFTWGYVVLKMIFKMFCLNPSVKFKLPVILGWLPFLLFSVAPYILLSVLPTMVTLPEIFSSLTISFFSSGLFALIGAVLLIIIWIPYGIMRKRLKTQIKYERNAEHTNYVDPKYRRK